MDGGLVINGTSKPQKLVRAGPKMEVGERLSPCGRFIINRQGQWRDVPQEELHLVGQAEYMFPAAEQDNNVRRKPKPQ